MKTKLAWVLSVLLAASLIPLTLPAGAQETKPQLFWVMDDAVKPSMRSQYFEAGKKWVALLKSHEYPYFVDTYWTGDNHVYWRMPISNYAEIDEIMSGYEKLMADFGNEFKAVAEAFRGTYESSRSCVYSLDLAHSMLTEEAESGAMEGDFVFFDIYYFEPETDAEIQKVWDELKTVLKDKKNVQSWYLFHGVMGTDNPMFVMAATAENATEFYQSNAAMWKILGEEVSKLRNRMMSYVRKQEQKTAWRVPDLCYAPQKK
jgi:hypothetical protein